MINVIPVFVLHRLREWEFKNMVSLGSALNSEPQRVQRGLAVVVERMRHEVTWHDRVKDLRVLSLFLLSCESMCPKKTELKALMKRIKSRVLSLSHFSLEKLNPYTNTMPE